MGTNLVVSVLISRGEDTRRHTQGRRSCEDRGRDWSEAATNQGIPRLTESYGELGRGKDSFPPGAFRVSVALRHFADF